jgi:tetratricopeptide (TPR) repeat protein
MSETAKSFESVIVSIVRFASNLIPPLNTWVKKKSQAAAEKGSIAFLAHQYDLAEKYFKEALVWQNESSELHYKLARAYYENNKSGDAEAQFRKALAYDYHNLEALKGLGLVRQERDDLSEAMYLYLRYLESNPKDPVVCHNLGALFYNLGDYETAVEYYHRAQTDDDTDPLTHKNLALALVALGRPEEAKVTLMRAHDIAPEDAEVDTLLGYTLEALGDPEAALQSYESSLAKDPKSASTHLSLASLDVTMERYQEGVEHARTAADLFLIAGDNLSAGEAYWELGWCYYRLGEWDMSLEASFQALKLNPSLTPVHFNVGLALLQLRRTDEARKEYQQGLALVKVSDLKKHGIDDLQEALTKAPELPGAKQILDMLEERYSALSEDVAKSVQSMPV